MHVAKFNILVVLPAAFVYSSLCGCSCSNNSQQISFESAMATGDSFFAAGEYRLAEQFFTEAIRKAPDNGEAYLCRADARALLRQYEDSNNDITKALDLGHQDKSYLLLARAFNWCALGNLEEATTDCASVLRSDPHNPKAHETKGMIFSEQCKWASAINAYDRANSLTFGKSSKSDHAYLLTRQGIARKNSGDLQGAMEDFNKVLRETPTYGLALLSRGELFFDLGEFPKAIEDYDAAIALRANYALAYLRRGEAKKEIGETKSANADIAKAKEIEPQIESLPFWIR